MKITFEAGHFEMFVDGELRAFFEDEHFDQIDVIGFRMMSPPEPGDRGSGWVDSFTILAPFLSVKLEGKLSTTWGQIKVDVLLNLLARNRRQSFKNCLLK